MLNLVWSIGYGFKRFQDFRGGRGGGNLCFPDSSELAELPSFSSGVGVFSAMVVRIFPPSPPPPLLFLFFFFFSPLFPLDRDTIVRWYERRVNGDARLFVTWNNIFPVSFLRGNVRIIFFFHFALYNSFSRLWQFRIKNDIRNELLKIKNFEYWSLMIVWWYKGRVDLLF